MIPVRQDSDAQGLRVLARLEKVGKVVLRLLGLAHILEAHVTQDRDASGVRIHFDLGELSGEAWRLLL